MKTRATDAPGWKLDEVAHAGPEHLDAEYVARFDEKSPTDWSEDIRILRELGIGSESTVVDIGAGTGAFAEAIAPQVRRVVAVDISEPMVAAMRARGIEAVRAGLVSYEHLGDPPDAVYTRHALHHLPDFWKAVALDRIGRLLPQGGVLRLRDLVFDFEPGEADTVIASWLEQTNDDPRRGWTAKEIAEHIRGEFSTFTWLLEPMLDRAGFEIRDRQVDAARAHVAYTCVLR
jgi:SAM-dependent methyltransferase